MSRGLHPAAVARTTPEARRGRALVERLSARFPGLSRSAFRRMLAMPSSRRRTAFLRYAWRRGYAAFNRRDWELNTALHHPTDYTWNIPELNFAPPDMVGTYHGVDGYLEGVRIWLGAWEDLRIEFEDLVEAGPNRILVLYRQFGRGSGSGITIEGRRADLAELRDGWIVSQTLWDDADAALRSVGLEPESAR